MCMLPPTMDVFNPEVVRSSKIYYEFADKSFYSHQRRPVGLYGGFMGISGGRWLWKNLHGFYFLFDMEWIFEKAPYIKLWFVRKLSSRHKMKVAE